MVQQPIRLLQITDSHLFADSAKRLLGLDTDESFLAVVDLALKENRGKPIGAILATGDIAQDASQRAYQHYHQSIQQFKAPILYLPGNHDNIAIMKQSLRTQSRLISPCQFRLGNWSIIMLDSSVLGEVYGRLETDNLEFLDRVLSICAGLNVIVCLHHHPILCGSTWLDGHNLKNAPELWAILNRHSNIRALVWGHIHQDYYHQYTCGEQSFPCYAPPSTCIQFKPQSHDFALDTLNPGYRWFDLYPDGRLQSGVSRTEKSFHVDKKSSGY